MNQSKTWNYSQLVSEFKSVTWRGVMTFSQQKSVTLTESRSICRWCVVFFQSENYVIKSYVSLESHTHKKSFIHLKLCYENDKNNWHSGISSSNSDACQRLCCAQLSIFMTVLAALFQVECCYTSPGRQRPGTHQWLSVCRGCLCQPGAGGEC